MKIYSRLWLVCGFVLVSWSSTSLAQIPDFSQFGAPKPSNVKLNLEVDQVAARPGDTVHLVLTMDHDEGWNSYWINPGIGLPTELTWTLPEGFTTGETLWPIPKIKKSSLGNNHVYGGKAEIVTPLIIPSSAPKGEITISLAASWQECDATGCIQGEGSTSVTLNIGDQQVENPPVIAKVAANNSEQPRTLQEWEVSVGGNDGTFEVVLTPGEGANSNPGDIYFFEATEFPKLKAESLEVSRQGGSWFGKSAKRVIKVTKRKPVDSAAITGFLYAPNGWLSDRSVKALALPAVSGTLPPIAEIIDEKSDDPSDLAAASAEDLAAGARLYDAESRPEYELLHGKESKLTLIPALGLIFLGGLILNLMPCVFPILAVKILGFVSQAGEHTSKVKAHGLVFGLGVISSMWVLSGIVISLGLDWGAQMQNPSFVAGIVIIMFLLGLNMAGVFELGTSLMGVGGELQGKSGYSGSFFSGILTTLVATPCSGPFLGAVMAFALSQKNAIAFLVFTFFALGIALPYVLLSFFPKLIHKLPPPGAWMEVLKKGMSFALFATAVFFLGSFAQQTGFSGMSWFLFALVVIGLAAWIYGTWGTPFVTKYKRYILGYGLAGVIALVGLQMVRVAAKKEAPEFASSDEWKLWYPGVMEVSRSKQQIAWVDYTAKWCLNCQTNKSRVFSNEKVIKKLEELNVVLVRADKTKPRPEIDIDLKRFNRSALPVNIIVPRDPSQPYILMPEFFGPEDALKALAKAAGSSSIEMTGN